MASDLGDSLVVESGRFVMLNDGGSSSASAIGEKRILPYLKQRGIAALDAVVVTHPDADHTNGILELLELIGEQKTALRIRHLFLPVWMKGSEKENPFILAAQKAGIMVEYLKKGDEIRAGELTVSVLHPGAGEDYTGEENAGSVVLQLSCGACRALLTGDLEGSGEEEVLGAAERCQILKVAHHGSRNSTSEAFLNRIQPQISLISCAWPGRYGHPHRELLERLFWNLVSNAMKFTEPGGHILDPFAGSGTTVLAAVQEGYTATGIEVTDTYAELARERIRTELEKAA